MKLHFSIPAAEELREGHGGRYVLYSLFLEGFLLGKARYRQLRRWDEQLRQVFGSAVPAFPPKFYLAMTQSMADERRSQLEQYLQKVTLDANITKSEVFINFFRKLQLATFKIQTQRAFLDVYLADGSNITLDIQTSDTAERILQVTSCKMGIARELIKYFSFFFIQDRDDGALSVVKKVADFELPYVSLQSMKDLDCKLGIRKWYMDPSLDTLLTDCKASMNLLYMQVKLKALLNFKTNNFSSVFLVQFLEKIREVQFYGYVRLDPCICDYPEVGCSAEIYAGNNEINCCIKLPTNQTKEVSFKINRLRSWQVTFLGEDDTLEFRFEYNDSGTWEWIILYTKQAFLLSSCLKKMISEQMIKETNKVPEMVSMCVVHSSFISRKRFLVRPNEEDCVFEKIREEDL
uniref:Sorting nexin 31 n=1 Tax=Anas platyrhynchos platyrhynchos TaxID=8840 RepID=A0A493TXP0_ANAPP